MNILRLMAAAVALALCHSGLPARAAAPDPIAFGIAIELGDIRSATKWLDEGLDPDFEANRVGTGLMIGAWEGKLAMMELFLSRGADVNRVNRLGEQALQLAALQGRLEAVKWLLEHGAEVNRTGKQWSALHYAVLGGNPEIVRLLIERGADVNARMPNDSTPLMLAAREGHEELTRALLDADADPTPSNDWGDSALTWAMRYGHIRIARLVTPPAEFARAVQVPPESFGAPSRSEPPPPDIADILRRLRLAEAQHQPTEELRAALAEAIAAHRRESERITVDAPKSGRKGAPRALVITAKKQEAGKERAEIVYDERKEGAQPPSTPAQVADILHRMRLAQSRGEPLDELQKSLDEALARLRKEPPAGAGGKRTGP